MTSRLPVELLSIIFINLRLHQMDRPQSITMSPLLLGAVCRTWRTIAWSTPEIWMTIAIDVRNQIQLRYDHVADIILPWLKRSDHLPISLNLYTTCVSDVSTIDESSFKELADKLETYSERFFYLSLELPRHFIPRMIHKAGPCLPILETLLVRPRSNRMEAAYYGLPEFEDPIEVNMAPNLKRAHIYSLILNELQIDWRNITSASVNKFDIGMVCQVLQMAPFLQNICVTQENIPQFRLPQILLRHHCLASLTIDLPSFYGEALLDCLVLPALVDLTIVAGMNLTPIDNLLRRSSSCLTKFGFNVENDWEANVLKLIKFLKTTPSIETLELKYWPQPYSYTSFEYFPQFTACQVAQAINVIDDEHFLPKLKNMYTEVVCKDDICSLDLRFRPASSHTITPPGGLHVPRFQPLYIYCLLNPDIQKIIPHLIESGFQIPLSIDEEYLLPFTEFLRQTLHSYSFEDVNTPCK